MNRFPCPYLNIEVEITEAQPHDLVARMVSMISPARRPEAVVALGLTVSAETVVGANVNANAEWRESV